MAGTNKLFSVGRCSQPVGREFDKVYIKGSVAVRGKRFTVYIGQNDAKLPRCLTWNSRLHHGVECLEVVFHADAGAYRIEINVLENYLRRIRPGANIVWDGKPGKRHNASYDLDEKILCRWLNEVESQIESKHPHRSDLDFWTIDQYANQPTTSLCTVHIDGREVGIFAEHYPHYCLKDQDKFRTRKISMPVLLSFDGTHRLEIVPRHLTFHRDPQATYDRVNSSRVIISSVKLTAESNEIAVHPLRRGNARPYPLDFWGWEAPLFYQRYNVKGAGLDYFAQVLPESFHRGANFVDIYLTDCNRKICPGLAGVVPWPDELDIPGREKYQHNSTTGWNNENLKALNRLAHKTGQAISWFTHIPYSPSHYEVPADWMINYTHVILRQFAELSCLTPEERIDGLLYETAGFATDVDLLLLNETVYSENPSLCFCESENQHVRTMPGLVPGRIGYFTCCDRGREDKDPDTSIFDKRLNESKYGHDTYFGQLNCRDKKYSAIYGDLGQDSVIKQINDFVRLGAEKSNLPGRVSGFEWLGEPREVTTAETRDLVYTISSDPVAAALAARLETYGSGGRYDQQARRYEPFWYRRRYEEDISHTAYFIQNNYFRCYCDAGLDGMRLVLDTSASAHFDSDAPKITLSESFFATSTAGSVNMVQKDIEIVERGPYRAILKEKIVLEANEPVKLSPGKLSGIDEQRTYTFFSDMPCFRCEMKRTFRGAQQKTGTFLSLPGYDELKVGNRWYKKDRHLDIAFTQEPVLLRDSSSFRPELAVVLSVLEGRKPDNIKWRSGDGLSIWWSNPQISPLGIGAKQMHPVTDRQQQFAVNVFVLGSLYTSHDIAQLPLVDEAVIEKLNSDTGTLTVKNRNRFPVVKAVQLPRNKSLPFMVEEGGWWSFRGAQPSGKTDLVKVYLPPEGKAGIMRWDYIKDVVRPAPGSQYLVNLGEVKKHSSGCKLKARVNGQTPALLPRVQCRREVSSVKINGNSWLFFERNYVFLPKQEGLYDVEIKFGRAENPHIIAAHAIISKTKWTANTLSFNADFPVYTKKLPCSVYFYAAVDGAGRDLKKISGAKLVKTRGNIFTIKFKRGSIKMEFAK